MAKICLSHGVDHQELIGQFRLFYSTGAIIHSDKPVSNASYRSLRIKNKEIFRYKCIYLDTTKSTFGINPYHDEISRHTFSNCPT